MQEYDIRTLRGWFSERAAADELLQLRYLWDRIACYLGMGGDTPEAEHGGINIGMDGYKTILETYDWYKAMDEKKANWEIVHIRTLMKREKLTLKKAKEKYKEGAYDIQEYD